jgi:hypothetical protein
MHGEYARMIAAENVLVAYRSKSGTEDLVDWTIKNPALAGTLAEATKHYANSRRSQLD